FLALFTSRLLVIALAPLTALVLLGFACRAGCFRLGCCRCGFLGVCLGRGGFAFLGAVASAAATATIAFAVATFSSLAAFALLRLCHGRRCGCGWGGRCCYQAAQPAEEFRDQVVAGARGEYRLLGRDRLAFHD